MKKQSLNIFGLFCYLAIITLMFNFNWLMLIKPKPFLSVILGMIILTASQCKKGCSREDIVASLRWNLILASFLTTLLSLLSTVSSGSQAKMADWRFIESLLPMLYGSVIYLVIGIVFSEPIGKDSRETAEDKDKAQEPTAAEISERVFRSMGLTDRECHVALKLLGNNTNKEIAAQLYISEATVKKHIQNIYQKFGTADRSSFREKFLNTAKQ